MLCLNIYSLTIAEMDTGIHRVGSAYIPADAHGLGIILALVNTDRTAGQLSGGCYTWLMHSTSGIIQKLDGFFPTQKLCWGIKRELQ